MAESPFDDDIEMMKELAKTPSLEILQKQEQSRMRWEETCIKHILNVAGKGQEVNVLRQRSHDKSGESKLVFGEFHLEHPEFPILFFERLPFRDLVRFEEKLVCLRSIEKSALIRRYEALYHEINPPTSPGGYTPDILYCYGLIFEWLHHGSPFKIIHNQTLRGPVYPWTKITVSLPNHYTAYIEDLDSYLCSLGWYTPEQKDVSHELQD